QVAGDQVEVGQAAQQAQQLRAAEPARLRRAGARREGGVEHIDVDGRVAGQVRYTFGDRFDRPADAEDVDVAGPDGPEAEPQVVVEVAPLVEGTADADMDRVILNQESLLKGPPEDRAVCGGRVEVGVPGVQVRVEVHQRDRAVRAPHRPQHRQRDRVIATYGDDLPVSLQQVRGGRGDLLHGLIDRERGDRHVPRVGHLDRGERAAVELHVVARPQM